MRLLKVASIDSPSGLEMIEVGPSAAPPYAILSHTWTDDEVEYQDIQNNTAQQRKAYAKIEGTCRRALVDGYVYAWADCCCIDKSSSAELSEAINSMYEWYGRAETCYVYLADCPDEVDGIDAVRGAGDGEVASNAGRVAAGPFAQSRWFTRCWTLQELLAPRHLTFFSRSWTELGTKRAMSRALATITGIDEDIVTGTLAPHAAGIAKRMSWAAGRQSTRPEDVAYCLMGLFGVNMAMIYGEGDKAFLRLQEEIMKQSDDQSLFAWTDPTAAPNALHGLLARSPANFARSSGVLPYEDWEARAPYSMSNRGLNIKLRLTRYKDDVFVAALDCAPPDYEDSSFLAVYLQKVSDGDNQYARVKVGQLAKVHDRGTLQSVYVKQDTAKNHLGIYPNHVLQLANGPDPHQYAVDTVVAAPNASITTTTSSATAPGPSSITYLKLMHGVPRSWLPEPWRMTYRAAKAANQLCFGIVFRRVADGELLLVMVGSGEALTVAFAAVELPPDPVSPTAPTCSSSDAAHPPPPLVPPKGGVPTFDDMRCLFVPTPAGTSVGLAYHRVHVDVQSKVLGGTKYWMVNIDIQAIQESSRAVEAMKRVFLPSSSRIGTDSPATETNKGIEAKKRRHWWETAS